MTKKQEKIIKQIIKEKWRTFTDFYIEEICSQFEEDELDTQDLDVINKILDMVKDFELNQYK